MNATVKAIYIAGPMTGIPAYNYPAFIAAAEDMRERGFPIISPHELDKDANDIYDIALKSNNGLDPAVTESVYAGLLARDVQLIADHCDGICFLQGWERSKGARLEAFVAVNWGYHKFYTYHGVGMPLQTITAKHVMECVATYTKLAHGLNA